MNTGSKWAIGITVVAALALASVWLLGGFTGGVAPLSITGITPITAVTFDGKLEASWITTQDKGFYSDYASSADFVETKADSEVTGNITLTNFTASAQERQFAMRVDVKSGDVGDARFQLSQEAQTVKDGYIAIKSLDLKTYDENREVLSFTIGDNEVDQKMAVLAEGKYVLVGVLNSLQVSNNSVETLYKGTLEVDNSDRSNDAINTVNFDILGGVLLP